MYFPDVHVPALCVCVTCTCESDFFFNPTGKNCTIFGDTFSVFPSSPHLHVGKNNGPCRETCFQQPGQHISCY